MILKRIPEDFQVEELTDVTPSGGPFALYRLGKRWLGTPEAIEAVFQCWRIERQRVSYGGLKDFHGVTQQHVTIERGPRRDLHQTRFDLSYLGQVPRPFQACDVTANRFRIVLRDVAAAAAPRCRQALVALARQGVPNYFDDQRFGSLGRSGQFIAEPWCRGDYERALWLAVADSNDHDSPTDADEKAFLRDHWGDWPACQLRMSPGDRRRLVSFLAERPNNFRAAVARLPVDLRSLYASAFQSHLWNRLLDRYLRSLCRPEQFGTLPLRLGPVAFPRGLDDRQAAALAACQLPLPSARLKPKPGPIRDLLDQTLCELGIELRQIRIKYPRDTFFSKGYRSAVYTPQQFSHAVEPDDLYADRQKLILAFTLGRGCYATLLVKWLEAEVAVEADAR